MIGRVTSTKLIHTATIIVERTATHPLYKKTYLRTKKYLVDDPIGVKMGDIVEVIKCRPISRNKHWVVTKVIGKNLEEIVKEEQKIAAAETIAVVMPEEKVEKIKEVEEVKEEKPKRRSKKDVSAA